MYADGQVVPKDEKLAVELFRRSADQGHAPAQFNLGAAYSIGQGVPKDNVQAYVWYSIAAANGLAKAAKFRNLLVQEMSRDELVEAQRRSREHFEKQRAQP